MRTLVVGIGNTLLSDDGVGMIVAREIKERVGSVDVAESNTVGLPLLEDIAGYEKVVFIDSAGDGMDAGQVRRFDLEEIRKSCPFASHGINLPLTIELGRKCGEDVPKELSIYGIGTTDTNTFSEECTDEVRKAIPGIVDYIIDMEFNGGRNG